MKKNIILLNLVCELVLLFFFISKPNNYCETQKTFQTMEQIHQYILYTYKSSESCTFLKCTGMVNKNRQK